MKGSWTFAKKVGLGFAISAIITMVMSGVAMYVLRTVVAGKDLLITRRLSRNLIFKAKLTQGHHIRAKIMHHSLDMNRAKRRSLNKFNDVIFK